MGLRRQAREMALKMLFQIDLGELNPGEVMNYFFSGQTAAEEVQEYARELVRGVVRVRTDLDSRLEAQAKNWALDRMAGVDRNILRMALYELLHQSDVPRSVVINEAVELAKKYSGEESGKFVNGVLDELK